MKLRPVPFYTEGAIRCLEWYFKNNDNPRVLEFGSGASSVWISKRTANLISVENHEGWCEFLKDHIENNNECNPVRFILHPVPYYNVCDEFEDESFDLILVDGRNRKGCIARAISKLKPGGILLLDNSNREYYHSVYSLMEGWKTVGHVQKRRDSCGFYERGWETRWWFKPGSS